MSFSDEKMLILKMLEEGKITSEEAAKLIDALDNSQKQSNDQSASKQQGQPKSSNDSSKLNGSNSDWKNDFKSKHNASDFDRTMDDFSSKVERLGRNLAETTFGLVDKMTDFVGSFVDTNSFRYFGNTTAVDRSFEAEAIDGMTLNIEGIHGHISVKKNSENKIKINSRIRSHTNNIGDILAFDNNGSTVTLKLNNPTNISVAHEIMIPSVNFKEINLRTSNAKISIEDSISENLNILTKNGQIELTGVNCSKSILSTKNAKIQLGFTTIKDIEISTSNSSVDIKHTKVENLKVCTTNGRVTIEDIQNYDDTSDMGINIKNSNGRIKINMNDITTCGYRIKAQTTHGQINLLIPNMLYKNIGKQGFSGSAIETESNNFDSFTKKVFVTAETSNSYIEIGK